MEGFMKHAVEMGSGGVIYIQSFVKISSGFEVVVGRYIYGHRHTYKQQVEVINLHLFYSK
jgi:hypothetical protein